jgi:hypothetical protein
VPGLVSGLISDQTARSSQQPVPGYTQLVSDVDNSMIEVKDNVLLQIDPTRYRYLVLVEQYINF